MTSTRERTQERNLIADYVWAHCKGQRIDPHTLAQGIYEHWGIRIDHHPCAYLLDDLASQGKIDHDWTRGRPEDYKIPTV